LIVRLDREWLKLVFELFVRLVFFIAFVYVLFYWFLHVLYFIIIVLYCQHLLSCFNRFVSDSFCFDRFILPVGGFSCTITTDIE